MTKVDSQFKQEREIKKMRIDLDNIKKKLNNVCFHEYVREEPYFDTDYAHRSAAVWNWQHSFHGLRCKKCGSTIKDREI